MVDWVLIGICTAVFIVTMTLTARAILRKPLSRLEPIIVIVGVKKMEPTKAINSALCIPRLA